MLGYELDLPKIHEIFLQISAKPEIAAVNNIFITKVLHSQGKLTRDRFLLSL